MNRYLSHHGVVGMHWGVRRYQPYGNGGYNPKNKNVFLRNQKKRLNLTKSQKRILKIGIVATASVLAGIGAYHAYQYVGARELAKQYVNSQRVKDAERTARAMSFDFISNRYSSELYDKYLKESFGESGTSQKVRDAIKKKTTENYRQRRDYTKYVLKYRAAQFDPYKKAFAKHPSEYGLRYPKPIKGYEFVTNENLLSRARDNKVSFFRKKSK